MLSKLLKYEFKNTYKTLSLIYLISISIAIITRIFNFISDKVTFLKVIVGFIDLLAILVIISLPIMTFIYTIFRYYKTMVKDEGYLTHTLPVSKNSLVLSKLIVSVTSLILSVIVSIIVALISFDVWDKVTPIFKSLINEINSYSQFIIPIYLVILLVSLVYMFTLIYTSISYGQKKRDNKGLFSVIYGIAIYNITQIFSLISIVIPVLWEKDYFKLLNEEVPPAHVIISIFIGSFIVTSVMLIILYRKNISNLDNKLNLE